MTLTREAVEERRPEPAATQTPFVLLDDNLTPGAGSLLFETPVEIVRCDAPEELAAALGKLEGAAARGLHAAGFLTYELGYLLEPKLAPLLPTGRRQPLLWMGLFEAPRRLERHAVAPWLAERGAGAYQLRGLHSSIDRPAYLAALAQVKDYIAAGDVYQINLTFKQRFDFAGDPLALYAELRRKQRVAHGALVHTPELDVLSLSPELFLRVRDGRALAKPMKGTAARGARREADEALKTWLREDPKSRAENLMIVDLLRNDLGRVARIGSVAVPELFAVETYPTLHQMVSSVTARLRPGTRVGELLRGLFPCGSITGAPKVRAMEIIRELEAEPRGVYTGAVGSIAPDGDITFNVAIRTLAIHRDGTGELGIGSGIVHDSEPLAEYEECILKSRFLTDPEVTFQLIETLRWDREDGFFLLEAHLKRLADSAAHFGFPCGFPALRVALDRAVAGAAQALRVRLLLDEEGEVSVTAEPLAPIRPGAALRFVVSDRPVERHDPFLYHKTTRRAHFEAELARHKAASGCDEVLFVNEAGELTEGSWTNLFVERGGRLLTPPVESGLLDGTLRQSLFADPAVRIEERIMTPADLARAERIWLGNSVRGLMPARFAEAPAQRVAAAPGR